MAYGNSPTATNTDGVRLLVGDISTSAANNMLADSAYTFFLAQSPNLYSAAALACDALAALWASTFEWKQVGDMQLRRNSAERYRMLSGQFSRQANILVSPSAGGISISDKRGLEMDTDRVAPAFTRKLLDNPEAVNPLQPRSTGFIGELSVG